MLLWANVYLFANEFVRTGPPFLLKLLLLACRQNTAKNKTGGQD